jgi:DNA-binding NtrC family response regulator
LIVDDDDDIRANFSDILKDLGYRTTTAESAELALDLVRKDDFDAVLLDFKLPGMDGVSLYREIKRLRPSIPAIMITALAGSDGAQQAFNAGTWDVLRKPVHIPEMLDKLEQATKAPLVLVVDDDEAFCQSLWQILNERRFRVALAHSEADGIAKATASNYKVAIVDLRLGQGDGRNVIKRISQSVPDAHTVLVSGNREHVTEALDQLGHPDQPAIDSVCNKPIDIEHLLDLIQKAANKN